MPPRDPANIISQDDAPHDAPVNFGAWAPHVMGHLQRIESAMSIQLRTMAVLETKFDNFATELKELKERVAKLEEARAAAQITDASRVGAVTGVRWLIGIIIAGGSAVAGMIAYVIAHLPQK